MIPICNLRGMRMLFAGAARRVARMRSQEGSTLVEFAVTLPVFLTALTGAASFSLALYNMQQLSNATSVAVQAVADERGMATDPCAVAASSVASTLPNWLAGNFTYTMWITDGSTGVATQEGPTTGGGFSCPSGESIQSENYPVTLTISYKYSWLPILAFSPSSNLSATEGTMSY
jgi:Flp pilus assembly protein TadG